MVSGGFASSCSSDSALFNYHIFEQTKSFCPCSATGLRKFKKLVTEKKEEFKFAKKKNEEVES